MEPDHIIGRNLAKAGCSFFCGMAKIDVSMQSIFDEDWQEVVKQEADRLIENLRKSSKKEIDYEIKTIEDLVTSLSNVYRLTLPEELNNTTIAKNNDLWPGIKAAIDTAIKNIKEAKGINLTGDEKKSIAAEAKNKYINDARLDCTCKDGVHQFHIDGTDYKSTTINKKPQTETTIRYKVNSRSEMRTLFTDGFIDSLAPNKSKKNKGPYKDICNYRIYVRRKMEIFSDGKSSTDAYIDYVDYMCRPDGVLIISLKTDNTGMTLDDIADMQLRIKMINWYTEAGSKGHSLISYLFLFFPIIYAKFKQKEEPWESNVKSTFHQMFIGNKFYVYSVQQLINELHITESKAYQYFDYALYALGKLIDMDTMLSPESNDYPSSGYYQDIMANNTLSLYNNWKALAMNETFTILCHPNISDSNWGEMISSRYKLFLAVVYQKSFIFYMNMKYQHEGITQEMADKILEFDRYFNIALPSYNEVPIMFYNKMRKSMGLEEVYEVLSRKITTSAQKHAERRDRSFNTAIGYLAVLAIFSAAIDYINILKFFDKSSPEYQHYNFEDNWRLCFLFFIFVCALVIFGLQIFSRYRVFKSSWNYICYVCSWSIYKVGKYIRKQQRNYKRN